MNKEQFKKKLKYGDLYCEKHDYLFDVNSEQAYFFMTDGKFTQASKLWAPLCLECRIEFFAE